MGGRLTLNFKLRLALENLHLTVGKQNEQRILNDYAM